MAYRTAMDIIKSKNFPIWQIQLGAWVILYDNETGEPVTDTDVFSSGFIQDFKFCFKETDVEAGVFDNWYNQFEKLLQSKDGKAQNFYCKIILRK